MYNLSHSSPCDNGLSDAINPCNTTRPTPNSYIGYNFAFWECSTPQITEVAPSDGTSETNITIKGRGFSGTASHNKVKFGEHNCQVISCDETTITCRVDTSTNPAVGVKHEVEVNVRNRGNAFVVESGNATVTFELIPSISIVSPNTGSRGGGTELTITGTGFSEQSLENVIDVNGIGCQVISASYRSLKCLLKSPQVAPDGGQQVSVKTNGFKSECVNADTTQCEFTFEESKTPKVQGLLPTSISSPGQEFSISGSRFDSNSVNVAVRIGNEVCHITEATSNQIKCTVTGLVAGQHKVVVNIKGKGNALFDNPSKDIVTSNSSVTNVSPLESSKKGGLRLTITGNGFDPTSDRTVVKIGGSTCRIESINHGQIKCNTPPYSENPSKVRVEITVNDAIFPEINIDYTDSATPEITSISPASGTKGDTVTITGSKLDSSNGDVTVLVGQAPCNVSSSSGNSILCTLSAQSAGNYDVNVHVPGKGNAASTAKFTYELKINKISPTTSGYGGGTRITLEGHGFSSLAVIKVCGKVCPVAAGYSITNVELSCEVPSSSQYTPNTIKDQPCDVKIELRSGESDTFLNVFKYLLSMTSVITSVSPRRGGTGGGVELAINGSGFSSTADENKVTIDGSTCAIKTATTTLITCTTGPHNGTIKTRVRVEVGNQGKSVDNEAEFYYVDVWSSRFSWGNKDPPGKGTVV